MHRLLLALAVISFGTPVRADSHTARPIGIREQTPAVFALINARIVRSAGREIGRGDLVIRDGVIEAVGRRVAIPADAWVIDLAGKTIYPGFLEAYTHYGLPEKPPHESHVHWNPHVRSHYRSAVDFRPRSEEAGRLRSQGFVAAHVVPPVGLLRGSSAVVSLGEGEANRQIVGPDVLQALSFHRSEHHPGGYPNSLMGSVALIRQTFLDAEWYSAAQAAFAEDPGLARPEVNRALAALAAAWESGTPFLIDTADEHCVFRAAALADEFGLKVWVRGSGKEYRWLPAIAETELPVILPLAFPEAPEVGTPEAALSVSLERLRHYHLAAANAGRLAEAGVPLLLTSHGSGDGFLERLRAAVERGLCPQAALTALTSRPAEMLGVSHRYGSLEKDKAASFFVTDGDLFESGSRILEVWVDGVKFAVEPAKSEPRGRWALPALADLSEGVLHIRGTPERLRGEFEIGEQRTRLESLKLEGPRLTMRLDGRELGGSGMYRLSAEVGQEQLLGAGETAGGEFFVWTATRSEGPEPEERASPSPRRPLDLPARFPSMEYGRTELPEQPRQVLIRNATIWTQGPQGVLEEADMLVTRGVIVQVGRELAVPAGAKVIDAAGQHVTPGLIDPHLHTSILGGVNETGDAITSETRIADVMTSDNVWIYRLLAGGLTSTSLLHGSANPIGGQNAVIKLRWGDLPRDLLIADAAPGLKLALGENVKRASSRFPNTRQGVEQLLRDALQAAVAYGESRERYERHGEGLPVRRDLQLEALLEVIRGERRAHVHAYRQDEMLMMLRVAEDFGFTIASFEHTLEGYKIADELREHGAAAVVWTDWSSFKVEAQDGILYNARLLSDVGVVTALHSDDTRLATRMNWEAAKTLKTGVGEIDAMDMITRNPARILGIEHRTGTLESGKDADFVLWNGHPLSSFSIPQQTWVDGRKYFDREEDQQLREAVQDERSVIMRQLLERRDEDQGESEEEDE